MQTDQTAVFAILALILVAALLLWWLYRARRTAALRDRFGAEEYDRTRQALGGRGKAEQALRRREQRVAALDIRPLAPAERQRFTGEWQAAKARFVDDPGVAVAEADRAITGVMAARGYPVDDFDARYESLTVDHGSVARHYRAGRELSRKHREGRATTEDLRQALVHYEALFEELVDEAPARGTAGAASRQAHEA
ncbi:MAG: hypothetical protein ACEQR8_09815 [Cypionkella sp.]